MTVARITLVDPECSSLLDEAVLGPALAATFPGTLFFVHVPEPLGWDVIEIAWNYESWRSDPTPAAVKAFLRYFLLAPEPGVLTTCTLPTISQDLRK